MKLKTTIFILTACSYVRLYFSQDWMSIAAAVIITAAAILQIVKEAKS